VIIKFYQDALELSKENKFSDQFTPEIINERLRFIYEKAIDTVGLNNLDSS